MDEANKGKLGRSKRNMETMAAVQPVLARAMFELEAKRLFSGRGFSDRTAKALIDCIDAPERLLFMDVVAIRSIPGIGKAGMADIEAYRARFLPAAADPGR